MVFIATDIDQSWEWPPLFGKITEAYSMRNFWSKFWHRLVYKSFNFHSSVISRTILRILQGTAFSRILNNCLVFVLSAVMHATVTWRYGGGCAWGRSMLFWCVQPLAFVLEGIVQVYWRRVRKNELVWVKPGILMGFERIVGYAWVVGWLMWTAPRDAFITANCAV
ncbi:hypothetical protein P280DRAFT_447833 [Massarina eburnea CBS 473.64]|uniref:Wax synthase domain-containing protein n=1 Tax=Massarina eburnea CBS 473.64 TaxID=1395130 RepID=A0A6A6S5U4_9PLEO|nr:hypothetical protein P280DRAFT_447833 [Massarina eburnea CBS 473.64]